MSGSGISAADPVSADIGGYNFWKPGNPRDYIEYFHCCFAGVIYDRRSPVFPVSAVKKGNRAFTDPRADDGKTVSGYAPEQTDRP